MAVAAPARKTAPAPAPSRTTPPRRPRTRPTPKGRVAAPAPARRAPARRAPARKAPSRAPQRSGAGARAAAVGGQLIPLAGRTAVAVGQLPDSGLVMRMTRGRAWIGVLGLLLVGIVGLNVLTLSFTATAAKIDAQITALDQENPTLRGRDARLTGVGRVRQEATPLGLAMPTSDAIHFTDSGPDDVATAARRLAAASPG
jgi:hypothetical protein